MTAIAADRAHFASTRWRDAAAHAAARITWRAIVTVLAIALALQSWSLYEMTHGPLDPSGPIYVSTTIVNVLIAFSMMFTTFVADELVAVGARPLPAYASAIVAGSALGSLAQWLAHEALRRAPVAVSGLHTTPDGAYALYVFFEYLIWGSIGVWIYVNHRGEVRARTRMKASQLQRADMQRRSLEAQLKALQAQVEPQFLLDMLGCARDRYDVDRASGSAMLGALIAYLRAALPRLREHSSSLGRELELARAYLDVVRAHLGEALVFEAEIPESLHGARLPSMLMLPLIHRVLVRRAPGLPPPRLIAVSARVAGDRMRVRIVHDGAAFAAVGDEDGDVAGIREHLRGLYGTHATLAFEHGTSATLEIPFEPAVGDHR